MKMTEKEKLMIELLNRYQQLPALEHCGSAKDTVVIYIKELEQKLKELL